MAGVLNLVLAIGIIITAVVGAVILLIYQQNYVIYRNLLKNKLERNALSGISYLLASEESSQSQILDLFENGTDSVKLTKQPWGLYDLLTSEAYSGKVNACQIALVGSTLDTLIGTALYLADEDRPLYLAEATTIVGTCYLPSAGIKKVTFNQGQEPPSIKGVVKKSQSQLPLLNTILFRVVSILQYDSTNSFSSNSQNKFIFNEQKKLTRSFRNAPVFIKNDDLVLLNDVALSGKIIIFSNTGIKVSRTAHLKDLILIAPFVELAEQFEGNLQIFARDSIVVGRNSNLNYPSVICVYNNKKGGVIRVEDNTRIMGEIIMSGENISGSSHQLVINKGSLTQGLVYVNGVVEHNGRIVGGLFCKRLLHRSATAVYDNYLRSADINAKELPRSFLVSLAFFPWGRKENVKWLN